MGALWNVIKQRLIDTQGSRLRQSSDPIHLDGGVLQLDALYRRELY